MTEEQSREASFIIGGGANGELFRTTDWSKLPVGSPKLWPQSLRTALDICLSSRFPMTLYWGPSFSMLYNDDLLPMIGARKHPWALGRPAQEVLPEIWSIIGPLLQGVVDSGTAIWLEDLMLPMERADMQEEGYFTFSYSPVRDESGAVGGVLCAVVETTEKTIQERRLRLLNRLAEAMHAKTPEEACAIAAARIADAPADIPFALLYLVDQPSGVASLVGASNIEPDTTWSPGFIQLEDRSVWPLHDAWTSDEPKAVLLENGPPGARGALILRIERAGGGAPFGFVVVGLSTLLASGDSYARFHRLLAASISQSTSNAAARFAERDASERLRLLFAMAPVAVSVVRGPELVFALANPRYEQMVGRTGLVGKAFRAAFPELADDDPIFRTVAQVRRSGEAFVANEYCISLDRTGTGKLEDVFFLFTLQPIREPDGSVDTVLAIAVDVTEPVRLRRELENLALSERVARGQAEAASALKDEFLSTASHELRTPLNAILGWARLLASGTLEASAFARGVKTIERNAVAQVRLIEDILDGSRIITGKLRLDVRPLDLVQLLQAAIDGIRPAADAKAIELKLTLDPAAARMQADPDRLQQVIWNLLNNAIKFTPKGGTVTVVLKQAERSVELSVADTGEGIPLDFLPYIFERFRQADGSTTRRHGGLGLGLALVRHLVEAHGGMVRAESAGVGQGARFTATLPVRAAFEAGPITERPLAASAESPPLLESLKEIKALLVDDEPDVRELVAMVLRAAGASVVAASSVGEAYERATHDDFDILISDVGMPDSSGYELIRKIRADNGAKSPHLPAIALTAYAREGDRNRALQAGFDAHIPKPVEPADLVRAASELVRRAPR